MGYVEVRTQRLAEPERREEMKERQNKSLGPVRVKGWGLLYSFLRPV